MGLPFSSDTATRRVTDVEVERPAPIGAAEPSLAMFPFKATVDMAELDDRGRPGPAWHGRAGEISRNHLVFRSRRLCYENREILVAVHLVDDRPMPLVGLVAKSEYDGDGMYKTTLNLVPVPRTELVKNWFDGLPPRV